jgi:hypothetical protein
MSINSVVQTIKKDSNVYFVAYVDNYGSIERLYPQGCTDYQAAIARVLDMGWHKDQVKVYSVETAAMFDDSIMKEKDWFGLN